MRRHLGVTALAFALLGCRDDPVAPADYFGVWTVETIRGSALPVTVNPTFTVTGSTVELRADGSFAAVVLYTNATESGLEFGTGRYIVRGAQLRLTYPPTDTTIVGTITNTLIELPFMDVPWVFRR